MFVLCEAVALVAVIASPRISAARDQRRQEERQMVLQAHQQELAWMSAEKQGRKVATIRR